MVHFQAVTWSMVGGTKSALVEKKRKNKVKPVVVVIEVYYVIAIPRNQQIAAKIFPATRPETLNSCPSVVVCCLMRVPLSF